MVCATHSDDNVDSVCVRCLAVSCVAETRHCSTRRALTARTSMFAAMFIVGDLKQNRAFALYNAMPRRALSRRNLEDESVSDDEGDFEITDDDREARNQLHDIATKL